MSNDQFIENVWQYYDLHKRNLAWRNLEHYSDRDRGYRVLVSEVMLQQTQVQRVIPKYDEWIKKWPSIDTFCDATFSEVLSLWSGLGYNRRAKYLHTTLHTLMRDYEGVVPKNLNDLQSLSGIGANTAAAILVYTYNTPAVFVETNIRSAYLNAFFANAKEPISDHQLKERIAKTLDYNNPRQWYYALMDYGTHIKQTYGSHLHKSKHHRRQSRFEGSSRQIRGAIIKYLTQNYVVEISSLKNEINDDRFDVCIQALSAEGMIVLDGDTLRLP